MEIAIAVLAALVVGFLAGLLSFKKKASWCPQCGAVKDCVTCHERRRIEAVWLRMAARKS